MLGEATGSVASGTINAKGVNMANTHCGGTLYNQVRATYSSLNGDSGGPVFSAPDANNNVYFYGIHTGRITVNGVSYAVYSPW
jgi:hypothetical protein